MRNKKFFLGIFLLLLAIAPAAQAFADFNPNKLIDDKNFADTQTFGSADGIQKFLLSKSSLLARTDAPFLLMLREPQDPVIKTNLTDPEPALGRLRTAAELIWDASRKAQINPQVILVTLQKEQGLITNSISPDKLQHILDRAMGFGCPDSSNGGCDPVFNGFYAQLFGGFDAQGNKYIGAPNSLMRSFLTPGGRGPAIDALGETFGQPVVRTSHVNDTVILQNTVSAANPGIQPSQSVVLSNLATAALYRYTPHVYNGNYNFWKFFDQWFRYPNGTLLRLSGDSNTYIILNGLRLLAPNFVLSSRGLNPANAIIISPIEFSGIDAGQIYGPADNVIITDPSGKLYVFENSEKHPASAFVLKQRGLNSANAIAVSQNEADIFKTQSMLLPKDGTLIKGDASSTVYVIENQQRMILSAFTFKQYGYSVKNVVALAQSEVDAYDLGQFLLPKNGTLVKTTDNQVVYVIDNQLLRPVSETVFKLRKYKSSGIVVLNVHELDAAGLGSFMAPPEGTYFKLDDGSVYLFKNNSKQLISTFVQKQRAIRAVALSSEEGAMIADGSPLPPKDNTLIKGDQSSAIYVIKNGMKNILDYNSWVRKYGKRKPNVLPQAEVDAYSAPGDIEQ